MDHEGLNASLGAVSAQQTPAPKAHRIIMDSNKVVENIYLLVIVTLVSVLQNAFFAQKVERECKNHNTRTSAFERVSCAKLSIRPHNPPNVNSIQRQSSFA
ncbi:uncharacterized protein LOC121812892 isoform X2 [Haplochromis burtoni]|uniref:uncharacterized protein LOC121812892 isoform X2 n=1 Tax=Haplochromis burtoni TaxID=8153 RepID=UPI001C2D479C|nr:uncharacterized protein LOC121812892 isoform X2 [Haplochromis burtoni]